jgi:hypothetical protein
LEVRLFGKKSKKVFKEQKWVVGVGVDVGVGEKKGEGQGLCLSLLGR